MKQHIRQSLATFSLLSASIALAHAAPDVNQLQQQVSQLEKSLKLLKTELNQLKSQQENGQASDTQVRKGTVEEMIVSESIHGELAQNVDGEEGSQGFATQADVQGLQSDLENFKYQVQRERDTKTALSARQLQINGVVQTKASYLDEPQTTPPTGLNTGSAVNHRRSSFDLGAVQVGFTGNLFRD